MFKIIAQALFLCHSGRIIAGTQVRNGKANDLCLIIVAPTQRENQAVEIGRAVRQAFDRAAHIYIMKIQQAGRCFEACAGIVVAGNDHDLQSAHLLGSGAEKAEKHLFGLGRRIGMIEDIAGNEQDVGLLLRKRLPQPSKVVLKFCFAIIAVEGIAQMPIGCM